MVLWGSPGSEGLGVGRRSGVGRWGESERWDGARGLGAGGVGVVLREHRCGWVVGCRGAIGGVGVIGGEGRGVMGLRRVIGGEGHGAAEGLGWEGHRVRLG